MTWKNRVRPEIKLTSPSGKEFTGKWSGNGRDTSKKIGVFEYTRVRGSVVQDLDVSSDRQSITIYFDGQNHDQTAQDFYEATKERGQWEVVHPVKGFMGLQLIKSTEKIEPVKNGSFTEFSTEWVEPIDPVLLKTVAQLAAESGFVLNDFNDRATEQWIDTIKTDTVAERKAITNTLGGLASKIDKALGPLAELSDSTSKRFNEVQRGIQETLDSAILQPLVLAAQFQQLTQLPAQAITDLRTRLKSYADLAATIFLDEPALANNEGINLSASKELCLCGCIGALSQVCVTGIGSDQGGTVQTQAQVIDAITDAQNQFNGIVANLDADQFFFQGNIADKQYFSQSSSFSAGYNLFNIGISYLLTNFFSLKIEQRLILKRPRTPLQLTIEHYGTVGPDESNYQLFLDSNKLKGDEILLLQTGREFVIYA